MKEKSKMVCRYKKREGKRVTLINVNLAKNFATLEKVAKKFKKFGRYDWAYQQAIWLMEAVATAVENGEKTADITKMFNCDFVGCDSMGTYVLPQEVIQDYLISSLFKVESETEDELRLKLKWSKLVF